jgi:hypothetical protein
MMSSLQVSSIDAFREVEVGRLLGLCQNLRVVDDGLWFRDGWSKWFQGENERGRESHRHHTLSHQREVDIYRPHGKQDRDGQEEWAYALREQPLFSRLHPCLIPEETVQK